MRKFNVIVAYDLEKGIGVGNTLPWHFKADMEHFKKQTMGDIVIMGRNTWDSIPEKFRPLPGRENIVISSKLKTLEGAKVSKDLNSALAESDPSLHCWVIGGQQLYDEAMSHPMKDLVYVTKIQAKYECDKFFKHDLGELQFSHKVVEKDIDLLMEVYRCE